ncbi:MAG TPA: hypothetical protein VD963_01615 [Phycisphaerales bacterium]|nr:hypothetical protein [Phycisphaerales bacterium]
MADEINTEELILIVTGAHLRSEVGDRPIAYGLRERMDRWLQDRLGEATPGAPDLDPQAPAGRTRPRLVVCSDLWYLNDANLREQPTVSVGGPGVNALTAYLADKLPGVLVVDDVLMVQMDPGLDRLVASVWGINHAATVTAADAFAERYLDVFMAAAARPWLED